MKLFTHADVVELGKYANLDDTEVGEACSLLKELCRYIPYLNDDFCTALEKEVDEQLANFRYNTTIVVSTKEVIERTTTLKWKE